MRPLFKNKIVVHNPHSVELINKELIIYCQADDYYTRIFLKDRCLLETKTLKKITSLLSGKTFIRIHKSFLVNINYVQGIKDKNTIILESGIELPIARRRMHRVSKMLLHNR